MSRDFAPKLTTDKRPIVDCRRSYWLLESIKHTQMYLSLGVENACSTDTSLYMHTSLHSVFMHICMLSCFVYGIYAY